jgi:hypothetical protein
MNAMIPFDEKIILLIERTECYCGRKIISRKIIPIERKQVSGWAEK